jgi:hypothetical protein
MPSSRDAIARDIMDFCKAKRKRFITVKYTKRQIMCSATKKPYTPHQLGNGFRALKKKGMVEKVSSDRWQILSYELNKEKE